MRKTTDKPNALRAATASGVLEMLQVANTNLEKIQKCLEVSVTSTLALTSCSRCHFMVNLVSDLIVENSCSFHIQIEL